MDARFISDGESAAAYAIGLEWQLCATKAEAQRVLRKLSWGLAVESGEGAVVAALHHSPSTSLASTKSRAKHPRTCSALASIARTERNAVVFHDLGDGQWWVAAARNGAPLPDCDRIASTAEAHELLREMIRFVPSGVIVGSEVDAAHTVESVLRKAHEKDRKELAFKKPRTPYLAFAITGVAILGVFAGLFALQSVQAAREAAEKTKAAALAKLHESQRVDAAIRQYHGEVRASLERARDEASHAAPVLAQLDSWMAEVRKVQLVSRGFRLERVACDTQACHMTWRALPKSTLSGPGGEVEMRDDQTVTTLAKLPEQQMALRVDEDRLELVSRFHQLGAVSGLSLVVSPAPVPLLAPMPPKPQVPAERLPELDAIKPMPVGLKSEVAMQVPYALLRDAVALLGNSSHLQSIEMGPLTSASGAPELPQIKVLAAHVRVSEN